MKKNTATTTGLRWFLPFRLATYVVLLVVMMFWLHTPGWAQALFVAYSLLTLAMAAASTMSDRIRERWVTPAAVTLQFASELAIESVIVYSTGDINSPYLGLFLLTIVSAALVYDLTGTLVTASASSAAYSAIVWLSRFASDGSLPDQANSLWLGERATLYSLLLHLFVFYLVAFISGLLASRLRAQEAQLADTSLALRRARLETDDILRHLNSGLLTIDHFGVIVYFNRTAERILGYTESEVRGMDCTRAFGDRMPVLSSCLMDGIQNGIEHPRREIEILNYQRRALPIGLSTSILKDENGRPRGVIGIFSDLTAAKEMEEKVRLADRLAAVGELSASIAHEIRNPLAAISGSVEVLKSDLKVTGENERLMNLIVKESHRLSRTLTDFLTYARMGRKSYERVELCHLINDVIRIVRHHASYRPDITIAMESREALAYVSGDDDLLKQLLVNLIINSCEALEGRSGTVTVTLSVNRYGEVMLVVSDDGPGIPSELKERIFEPFYSTKKEGTGLGLAIVQRICSLLRLSIRVESSVGRGTSIAIGFPPSEQIGDARATTTAVPLRG
jgi:two-component system sensor histidine kinase PilS (NtrC family)